MSRMLAIDSATKRKVPKSTMNRELQDLRERLRQRILEEKIRQRAYELYEERGRVDGHHEEDWVQAEEQIRGEHDFEKAA
jgi:Protein of unknown function (DUF2934)